MNREVHRPNRPSGRLFLTIIGSLGVLLLVMISFFFYSLAEIRSISPQPYVTIVANNLSAKHKVVQLKAEIQNFTLNPSVSSLRKMQMKARIYKSSILQDLGSKRTLRVHQQYGNVAELNDIIAQLEVLTALLRQVTLDNKQPLMIASNKVDEIYASLNDYLSRFVSQVQKDQMKFNQYKEDFYNKQYVNLGIILVCSLVMIGIVSWMYWNQSKLSQALEERGDKLDQARLLAEQSATAKARFLANMSHEMRTPLNAVIGLSQKEYYLGADEQTRNFLSMINSSGKHLLKLINSVLDISKIEQGKMTLHAEAFYCSELIELSKTIFVDMSKEGVEVFFSSRLDQDYKLVSDRTKLLQIINNLSYNAVKFTESGYVDVHLAINRVNEDPRLLLKVTDTGIGMSQEQLSRVFEEFTQADDSITRKYGGTGLGLSICQSLVRLMDGEITVNSELGKGTEFSVSLPITIEKSKPICSPSGTPRRLRVFSQNPDAEALISRELKYLDLYDEDGDTTVYYHTEGQPLEPVIDSARREQQSLLVISDLQTPVPYSSTLVKLTKPYDLFSLIKALNADSSSDTLRTQPSVASPNHSLSALIVEDMRVNQIVAQKMLATLNVSTTTASNGQECLALIQQHHFDIIFMDIQMPVLDGIETLKRIRDENLAQGSAIVALTANTSDKDVMYYLEMGFNDVVPKPVRMDLIQRILDKYTTQDTR